MGGEFTRLESEPVLSSARRRVRVRTVDDTSRALQDYRVKTWFNQPARKLRRRLGTQRSGERKRGSQCLQAHIAPRPRVPQPARRRPRPSSRARPPVLSARSFALRPSATTPSSARAVASPLRSSRSVAVTNSLCTSDIGMHSERTLLLAGGWHPRQGRSDPRDLCRPPPQEPLQRGPRGAPLFAAK